MEATLDMMRDWAQRLLAFLFYVLSVLGGKASRGKPLAVFRPALIFVRNRHARCSTLPMVGVRGCFSAHSAQHTEEGRLADPAPLSTMIVVVIARFHALCACGADGLRTIMDALTPEGRHRETGRCPTGPPALSWC